MNGDIEHSAPEPPSLPRKVFLEKGTEGYGFNLHGEKGVHGQFISAVDDGSPAQKNDVRVGDRVIAVNEEDVEDFPHSKVVERIRSGGSTVTLLVVDRECDQFYKELGVKIPQDHFETTKEENAEVVQDQVINGDAERSAENGDVVDPSYNNAEMEQVPEVHQQPDEDQRETSVEETEENEDGNEYEEVVPKSSSEAVANPVETTTTNTESDEAPSNLQQQQEQQEEGEFPAPDSTTTDDTLPASSEPAVETTSPQLDMAAARPKPKRNEVKRATQNWKQKYDDFNKL